MNAQSPAEGTVLAESTPLDRLYVQYRRPLMQVFVQRKIPNDAAQDLLQWTFMQALKKIRATGLQDPGNVGGYLYRTACNLATAYWRRELAHRFDSNPDALNNMREEARSLDERVDEELLADCVRSLLAHLPMPRDREVLLRLYIHEEPREQVSQSLGLTNFQMNQVLWRARHRFGEILRRHGSQLGLGPPTVKDSDPPSKD